MPRAFLLELGTEDLPARYVAPLSAALTRGVTDGLARRGIGYGAVESFATPRRLAVRIADVEEQQPMQTQERTGPALKAAIKDGEPTQAGLGFARSCGVEFSELGEKDGKLYFARQSPGQATVELVPAIFEDTLRQMDELVPKRMRWGSGDETFVRPVQWLCCLFGSDVVALQRFGLQAGRLSFGHRFHAPAAIELADPSAYADALAGAHVSADIDARKAVIRGQIAAQAVAAKGYARVTEELLDEVTSLVEWPAAITGHFEERYLELPPEVIVATVETNQRYFTVFSDAAQTRLTNAFITVANIDSRDVGQVIAGNERVVRPRLSDAMFFWEQDLKQPLADYASALDTVTFQKDLGSTGDKVRRVAALAGRIASALGADAVAASRAAALCKADLVTKMVFEFPELQGLMGGYYAARGGESEAVAQAIREHYLPTQAGTPIPATLCGRIVAMADKLDSLAGIFAIGQKPTASKDPFALRRAALGVLRILIEGELELDLRKLLAEALAAQPAGKRDVGVADDLFDFVVERLRGYSLDRGASVEQFEAVRANGAALPLDFSRRLGALQGFAGSEAAASLAAADKRARNILRQAGVDAAAPHVSVEHFETTAEAALLTQLDHVETRVAPLREQRDYGAMLQALAVLKAPVDAFFESVMVMADNPQVRANRLALLSRLDAACREVADLSCLPG